jgi:uncharacterized protein (TIGR02145 family)
MSVFEMARKWGAFLILSLSVGCSDDSSSVGPSASYPVAKSAEDLGACGEEQQGDSVYVSREDTYFTCQDGFWMIFEPIEGKSSGSRGKNSSSAQTSGASATTLNIYVAADDTVPSIKDLQECNSSHEGRYVFIASLNGYMKCTGKKWAEYTPPNDATPYIPMSLDSVNKDGKSNLDNYFEIPDSLMRYSSSSAYYYVRNDSSIVNAEKVLGKCDSENDGAIVQDTAREICVSYDHLYYCKKGVWSGVLKKVADTLGFGAGTQGSFKEGRLNAPKKNMSGYCDESLTNAEHLLYVYDGGWRVADSTEVCFKKACSMKNVGETLDFKDYPFICRGKNLWEYMTIYERPRENYFNEDVEYGTMTDERDGKKYRTLKAGGFFWMAENLNYSGDDEGKCYGDDPKNCEITGRFYSWFEAMQVDSTYMSKKITDTLSHQGLCPEGWRIPSLSNWSASFNLGSTRALAKDVWGYVNDGTSVTYRDSYNEYGLTLLPSGEYGTNDWVHRRANFCTTSSLSKTQAYYMLAYTYSDDKRSALSSNYAEKDFYCHLRCIKKIESGED